MCRVAGLMSKKVASSATAGPPLLLGGGFSALPYLDHRGRCITEPALRASIHPRATPI